MSPMVCLGGGGESRGKHFRQWWRIGWGVLAGVVTGGGVWGGGVWGGAAVAQALQSNIAPGDRPLDLDPVARDSSPPVARFPRFLRQQPESDGLQGSSRDRHRLHQHSLDQPDLPPRESPGIAGQFAAAPSLTKDGPEEWVSNEGGFAARFPAAPGRAEQTLETPNGLVKMRAWAVEIRNNAFVITYADVPEAMALPERREELLASIVTSWTSQAKVENLQTDAIALGNAAVGRRARYGLVNGLQVEARVYLVGRRLYQTLALYWPKTEGATARAIAFLDSFRLLASSPEMPSTPAVSVPPVVGPAPAAPVPPVVGPAPVPPASPTPASPAVLAPASPAPTAPR